MRPEGIKLGRKVSWPALVALFLVPLLVVGSLVGLTSHRNDHRVTAAIVNADAGTEIDGQQVPMGRQLAAAMMDYDGGENIQWILADEASGEDGLATGEYSAVVHIPEAFSKEVMSFAANDADVAEKARVDVLVSRNSPAWDAELAQEIARIATNALNKTLTEQYLDGIYVGFNEVGGQFGQLMDGVDQLDDGASQLADGVGQASDGTVQLSDGLGQLSGASTQIVDGGSQLSAGGGELADGASQLAAGVGELNAGVQEMAGQMPALVDGVGQLASGADQLLPGVAQYTDGVGQLVGGVGQLGDGLDQMVAGMDSAEMDFSEIQQLVDGSAQLADGARQVADGVDQVVTPLEAFDGLITDEMVADARQLADRAQGLGEAVTQADRQMQGYASGELAPPAELDQLAAQLKAGFQCAVEDPEVCEQQRAAFEAGVDQAVYGGFRAGAARGTELLNSTEPESGKTYLELAQEASGPIADQMAQAADGLAQAQQLIPGLMQLRDGAEQVATGNEQLADGIALMGEELPKQLTEQMGELRGGLVQLRDGADQIVEQSQPLVTGGAQLGAGATQLNDGIQRLASEVSALPEGVEQLADGTAQLATGATELGSGVGEYTSGVAQYVDGVWQFTDGVGQTADGAVELADGMTQLDDGASQLSEGIGTMSDELAAGADQLPNYSESDRETLADVVSSPIGTDDSLLARGATPLMALALVAGLWLAGLAAFTITRPVPSDVVMSRAPSWLLWLRTVGIPTAVVAGAGAALGVVGGVVLGLGVGRTVGLMALLAFLGAVFALVHHALTGWLGHVGRAISMVLLAVTVALGLSSGVPAWLDVVAALSPLQGGLTTTRGLLAGHGEVTQVLAMVFVGALFAALSWAAIGLRRQLTPAKFQARLA